MVSKYAKQIDRTRKDFEAREVYKPSELTKTKLAPTGYEAYRVSPRTTTKYGRKYKRVYGATVSPTRSGKGADVTWYPHAYTTSKVKAGTRMIQSLRYYPVDRAEARRKLMIRPRRAVRRRK